MIQCLRGNDLRWPVVRAFYHYASLSPYRHTQHSRGVRSIDHSSGEAKLISTPCSFTCYFLVIHCHPHIDLKPHHTPTYNNSTQTSLLNTVLIVTRSWHASSLISDLIHVRERKNWCFILILWCVLPEKYIIIHYKEGILKYFRSAPSV